ncbi:MAG: type III pantothenate kinase [Clostridia bacterium]|nr:type III pantothenate kinase [Clostridia bacterium]
MLLAVDIGNTNLTVGLYDGEKLTFLSRLATDTRRTAEQYAAELNQIAALEKKSMTSVQGAIIGSVVPELTGVIKRAIFFLTGCVAKVLGPGLKSGLNIRIDNPAQLGADLVAGAVAAVHAYDLPCLVMDLGTATKISVLDEKGDYRGCTISAGVALTLSALANAAAQLPTVSLEVDVCPAYGTNTVASMQAGIILGTASMLDGLCDRIEESLGTPIRTVVATGGLSGSIAKHCKRAAVCEPNLVLDGLRIIYEKNQPAIG